MLVIAATISGGWSTLNFNDTALIALSGLIGIFVGDVALFTAMARIGPRRTGMLFTLNAPMAAIGGAIFFEERQEGLRRIVKIINSPMSDKLNYSKELTQLYRKDKERVLYELKIWKNLFRKILKTEDMNEDLETISIMSPIKKANKLGIKKNIQTILKTEDNLKFNGMPSLVFDNFIINLEA